MLHLVHDIRGVVKTCEGVENFEETRRNDTPAPVAVVPKMLPRKLPDYDANLDPAQDILYFDPGLGKNTVRDTHEREQSNSKTLLKPIARIINSERKQSILAKHNTVTRRKSQKHRIHSKKRRSEQPGPSVRKLKVDFIAPRPRQHTAKLERHTKATSCDKGTEQPE
ncbi:hypothetical protein HG531_009085 [Fusarium graminearum]|nr:hypothetical protein HG531_009085 [Fusarium graminearum]